MSSYEFATLKDFSGGLNTHDSPDELLDNQTVICENVDFTGIGGIKPRNGMGVATKATGNPFTLTDSTTTIPRSRPPGLARIHRLIELERNVITDGKPSTVIKRLALVYGFGFYDGIILAELPDGTVSTLHEVAYDGTTLGSVVNPDSTVSSYYNPHLDYEVYKEKAYILLSAAGVMGGPNNSGIYACYDGDKVKELASIASIIPDSNLPTICNCKFIEQRGERIFMAGNPNDPNALYYSEPGEPAHFEPTSIIQAISDDGDIITGIKEFHGALLVFKSRAIYAWYGWDPTSDVEFQKLSVHTGTTAYRTITQVGNYLMFLGEDGVYALYGTYQDVICTKKISTQINDQFSNISIALPFRNNHWLHPASAVYYKDKYMVALPEIVDAEASFTYSSTGQKMIALPKPSVSKQSDLQFFIQSGMDDYMELSEYISTYGVEPIYVLDFLLDDDFMGGGFCFGSQLIYVNIPNISVKIKYKKLAVNKIAVLHTDIGQDVISAEYNAWSIYTNMPVSEFLKSCDGTLYASFLYSTGLYKLTDTYEDSTDAVPGVYTHSIPVSIKTKPLSMNAYVHKKKVKNNYVTMELTEDLPIIVNIQTIVDETSAWHAATLAAADKNKLLNYRLPVHAKGKRISFYIIFSCLNNAPIIHGITTEYKLKKPDRGIAST